MIVVGGGVSGLAAGALLARRGMKVTLFEANEKLGGCCATTNVEGYTFNDGALFLVLPGLLDHVFDKLGLNRAALLPLRKITANQRTTLPDGTVVSIAEGLDVTVTRPGEATAQNDPKLQDELRRLLEKWEPVLRFVTGDLLIHPFSIARLLLYGWRHLSKFRGTVAAELNRTISDEAVRAALASILLYSGLPPRQTPAISLLGIAAMLTEGFFLPEGGMGKIPEALGRALTEAGGEIHLSAPVRNIRIRGGRIAGVEVEGRGTVEADAVVSTTSGMVTFGSLLAPEDVPGAMRRKVEKAPLSHKAFALQLGLAKTIDAGSYYNNVVPLMDEQDQVFLPSEGCVRWPIYYVPTVAMPELAVRGGSVVEMYPSIRQDMPADAWDAAKEQEIAELAIQALSQRHDVHVAVKRTLSPRHHRDRLHLYQGAVYGLSPTADPRALFPHKAPAAGLYLAGQTTYPGYGVGAAAMSGILAAEALLKEM